MFKNRTDAGRSLAQKLEHYRNANGVMFALPRGGVVLGREVADALAPPVDILSVRKIGHPLSPEYAIGAVDEDGLLIMNEKETATISKDWLKEKTNEEEKEAKRRAILYRRDKNRIPANQKIAIIVDDGIATGFTVRLAVRNIRNQNPNKLIIAVPAAPPESMDELKNESVDEIITLEKPEDFMGSVGAHYVEFDQVEDDEVIRLLH